LQEQKVLLPQGIGLIARRDFRAALYPYDLVRGEDEQHVVPKERQQRQAKVVDIHDEIRTAAITTVIRLEREVLGDAGVEFQDEGNDSRNQRTAPSEHAIHQESPVLFLVGPLAGSHEPTKPRDG